MNNSSHKSTIQVRNRTILVSIDVASASSNYLEKAAELASVLNAQLAALYIEDEDLLAAAEFPFSKEICFHTHEQPISLKQVERNMKLLSARAKEHFEEIANRWKIKWSYQTVRGKVAGELNRAAATVDIISFGMDVFRDMQLSNPRSDRDYDSLPCLLFPNFLAHGEDIIVFATAEKDLEAMLAPVNGLVKKSRVVVVCTSEIYTKNQKNIDDYLHQAGQVGRRVELALQQLTDSTLFDLLDTYQPKLIIVDKTDALAKSNAFYSLLSLSKASGLLI